MEPKKTMSKTEEVYKQIEKKFGKGIIVNSKEVVKIDVISTGAIGVDRVLGVGGLPRGRIIELYGNPSAGKSTLSFAAMKQAQLNKLKIVYVDAEHSFNYEFAEKMKINIDDIIIVQPEYGEQALQIVEDYVETGEIALIIVDSVASLIPKAELDGEIIDAHIGLQARMMSQALRTLAGSVKRNNVCLVCINQIRDNINTRGYGEKIITPGGRALKFYASVRIDVRASGRVKKGEECIGIEVKAKIVKNKVAAPFKTGLFRIYFDEGLSEIGDVLLNAIKMEIIKKAGAWFSYKDYKWQGEEQVRTELKTNKKLVAELKKELKC